MINTLLELTKGETRGNKEQFELSYYCGIGVIQALQLDKILFTFYDDGQEILIYNDNQQCIYSCNYISYCDVKFINSVYNKDGLYHEFTFDYESKTSQCLYDIWELKQEHSERWIYRLEPIYNKYGVDIVNSVRENAFLFSM